MERRPKVLVVDDEPAILQSTQLILECLGYHVLTLQDASRILELLRRERPDVLLQDVRMPGLDVADLARRIRADPALAGTPRLLFSADLDLEEIHARVASQGVVEKPFRPHALDQTLRAALS